MSVGLAIKVFFAAAAVIAGFVLIRVGRRGICRPGERSCARCSYILGELAASASRCPECGADLARQKAVLPGQRKKAPALIIAGVLVLMSALSGIGWGVREWYRTFDLTVFQSNKSLINELPQNNYFVSNRLAKRFLAGDLAGEQVSEVIAALQLRDPTGSTHSPITDALARAMFMGHEDEPRFQHVFDPWLTSFAAGADYWILDASIADRIAEGRLSAERFELVFAKMIKRMSSYKTAPDGNLARLFEEIVATGKLSTEKNQAYFEALIQPQLSVQGGADLWASDTVWFDVHFPIPVNVIGTRVAMALRPSGSATAWLMAGEHIRPAVMRCSTLSEWEKELGAWVTLPDTPGRHILEIEVEAAIYELEERGSGFGLATSFADPLWLGDLSKPKVRVVRCVSLAMEVKDRRAAPFALVESSLTWEEARGADTRLFSTIIWARPEHNLVHVELPYRPRPDVACDVFIRQGDVESFVGWVYLPNAHHGRGSVSGVVPGIRAGPAQLVLRPSRGILRCPREATSVWDKEIVIDEQVRAPDVSAFNPSFIHRDRSELRRFLE